MQIDGENYLAAVDTDTEGEVGAKHSSLPLNQLIALPCDWQLTDCLLPVPEHRCPVGQPAGQA